MPARRPLLPTLLRLLAAGCLPLAGGAWAADCAALPAPAVRVVRLEAPVTLDTSYDYASITVLGAREHHPDNRTLGLTRGISRVTFQLGVRSVVDATGQWECASPQIVVSYGFDPLTVYVAREFPQGSCAFKEIYEHELRHVQTYQQHLAAIEKEIAATLAERFATGEPYRGPAGQTQQRLAKELNERWLPYVKRQIERVNASQALIDTPQEYARVADSCGGTIRRVVR